MNFLGFFIPFKSWESFLEYLPSNCKMGTASSGAGIASQAGFSCIFPSKKSLENGNKSSARLKTSPKRHGNEHSQSLESMGSAQGAPGSSGDFMALPSYSQPIYGMKSCRKPFFPGGFFSFPWGDSRRIPKDPLPRIPPGKVLAHSRLIPTLLFQHPAQTSWELRGKPTNIPKHPKSPKPGISDSNPFLQPRLGLGMGTGRENIPRGEMWDRIPVNPRRDWEGKSYPSGTPHSQNPLKSGNRAIKPQITTGIEREKFQRKAWRGSGKELGMRS